MDVSTSTVFTNSVNADTRRRLLEAAGEVFAPYGFRKATVREICKRAKANIAAVNYHFRDKDGLYSAMLQYAHQCASKKYPPHLALGSDVTAEQQLIAFARSFLLRIFDEGRPAWHGKLMAREMNEPICALDVLVENEIRTFVNQFELIIRKLHGVRANDKVICLCARSIVAQCVFYHHARPVINRLYPNQKYNPEEIEQLAKHITRFSLGALKEFRKQLEVEGK